MNLVSMLFALAVVLINVNPTMNFRTSLVLRVVVSPVNMVAKGTVKSVVNGVFLDFLRFNVMLIVEFMTDGAVGVSHGLVRLGNMVVAFMVWIVLDEMLVLLKTDSVSRHFMATRVVLVTLSDIILMLLDFVSRPLLVR